jgi:ribonucleotide reductase beta subunit family protein with ferritin-like domain
MNDKQKLLELLKSFAFVEKQSEEGSCYSFEGDDVLLHSGTGYSGFYCIFHFDEQGKFTEHGFGNSGHKRG